MIHRLSFVPPYRANGPVPARSYREHRAAWSPEDRRHAELQCKLSHSRNPKRKALVSLPAVNWLNREDI